MTQHPILYKLLLFVLLGGALSAGLLAQNNQGNMLREQIHVHTDRDIFIAGEHMYFSMYLFSNGTDPGQTSSFAYLALRNETGVVEGLTLKLGNGEAHSAIYLHDTLSTGFYELVGFTNWMRNGPETTYFRKPVFIANRFDDKLDVITRPPADQLEKPAEGTTQAGFSPMGISVPSRELGKRSQSSIRIESGHIPGSMADISVSIAQSGTILMQDVRQAGGASQYQPGHNGTQPYVMETDELILSGKVVSQSGETTMAGETILLSVPDTLPNLKYTISDQDGIFHFLLNDYYYDKEIFLSLLHTQESEEPNIMLSDKFHFELPPSTPDPSILWEKRDMIRQSQDIVRIQKTYGISHKQEAEKSSLHESPPPLIYSRAHNIIYAEHYIPLDDVYEMVREIIPAWRIRRSSQGISHNLTNATTRTTIPGQPVFFLEGIFIHDPSTYFDLSSPEIYKVELHNVEWMHGKLYFPGIISIVSNQPEINLEQLNGHFVRTVLESPARAVQYTPPAYDRLTDWEPHLPDTRQLMHWQPSLRLQNNEPVNIPFSTGDIGGEFVITIMGITTTGQPIFHQESIFVH